MRKRFLLCSLLFPALLYFSSSAFASDKSIYGIDNRRDVVETDPFTRKLARSVAAVFNGLEAGADGLISLPLLGFGTGYSLCPGEPFADQPTGSFCTASLVAPDLVLTAGHCAPSPASCRGKQFVFGFEMGAKGEWPSRLPASDVYSCAEIIGFSNGETRDFAVIRLDRPVAGREPLALNRQAPPEAGAGVFVIGTPLGLPLKMADGARVRSVQADSFMTDLDTFGGNSGSPVFNTRTGLIEGIIIAGGQDLQLRDDVCVVNYLNAQDEGAGEQVAMASQFSSFIP